MKLKFKLCTFILLIIVFTMSLAGCSNAKQVGIGLLGGRLSEEPQLNENRLITDMEIPTRDDGAQFQGWYTNLSFNEEVDITQPIPENSDGIIAKWDKCYLFTLVYNRKAFYGVERDGIIGYYIPAGIYKIQMLKDSGAQIGSILICSNSGYSYSDGYPIIKTIRFNNGEIAESVVISDDQHIEVTINSIFQFERVGVNQKYLSRNYDYVLTYSNPVEIALIIIIGGLIILGLLFLLVWVIMAYYGKDGKAITNYIIKYEGASINELSSKLNIKVKKIKFLLPWLLLGKELERNFYYDKKQELIVKGVKINNDKILTQSGDFSKTNFIPSTSLTILASGWSSTKLLINNNTKEFVYQKGKYSSKVYKFSDLINYEVYENGKSQVQGRAGSALIGGAFFGLGGLIVGSSMSRKINEKCNQLKLIIRLNDFNCPQIVITYVDNVDWDKNGWAYRNMKENLQSVCSMLEFMLNEKTLEQSSTVKQEESHAKKSNKEQLQELKEMLDDGLITQEDFEQKKKQILGL